MNGRPKYAIAPSNAQEKDPPEFRYLTPGKKYKIVAHDEDWDQGGGGFRIVNDDGRETYCLATECAHLHGGAWMFSYD